MPVVGTSMYKLVFTVIIPPPPPLGLAGCGRLTGEWCLLATGNDIPVADRRVEPVTLGRYQPLRPSSSSSPATRRVEPSSQGETLPSTIGERYLCARGNLILHGMGEWNPSWSMEESGRGSRPMRQREGLSSLVVVLSPFPVIDRTSRMDR